MAWTRRIICAGKGTVEEGDWKPSTLAPNRRETLGDKATTLEVAVKTWDQLIQALVFTKMSLFQPSCIALIQASP